MADNEDVVRQGYDLFSKGDMDNLKKLFTADFVHHVPGKSQLAGDHMGPDGAVGLYGRFFELSGGTMKVDLESVKGDGDQVVSTHRLTAEAGGKKLDQDESLTFTVKGDKIAEVDEKPSDQAQYDAFWG